MKKNTVLQIISGMVLILTIVSPFFSFVVATKVGEVDTFGVAGIVRYSWVMLLFAPIGVLSIIVAIILKKNKNNYKANLIAGLICMSIIIIFGSYRFIFKDISYDESEVDIIEQKINIDMPNNVKISSQSFDSYRVCYIKITDESEIEAFEDEIRTNDLWISRLKQSIKGIIPITHISEMVSFEYFIFYDITNGIYNECPDTGQCDCVFIAYDEELHRFLVIHDYTLEIK